ncbi:hypothetical protein [Rhizobium leucaenae]|nr:hypothetical protein [Rhizobium leucaenae]
MKKIDDWLQRFDFDASIVFGYQRLPCACDVPVSIQARIQPATSISV